MKLEHKRLRKAVNYGDKTGRFNTISTRIRTSSRIFKASLLKNAPTKNAKKTASTVKKSSENNAKKQKTTTTTTTADRSSSHSSTSSQSSSKDRSTTLSSTDENSSDDEVAAAAAATTSQEQQSEDSKATSKVRKSKRVKHLIKRAAANSSSLSQSNKKNSKSQSQHHHHHGTTSNQKFEDNYYYYYGTGKPSKSNGTPKNSNESDNNNNNNSSSSKLLNSANLSSQANQSTSQQHIQQKHKLSKILKKLSKKTTSTDRAEEIISPPMMKLENKEIKSEESNSSEMTFEANVTLLDESNCNFGVANGDNKENFKKETENNFKPYTQNILLQIQSKSMPVHIEVLTSKWCEKNSRKVLRLTSKLLQLLDSTSAATQTQPKWKELEFDYEKEITVKMFSSSRISTKKIIQFKADESSDELEYVKPIGLLIQRYKRETSQLPTTTTTNHLNKFEQKLFNSLSDLIVTHGNVVLIDLKTFDSNVLQTQNELNSASTADNLLKNLNKNFLSPLITPTNTPTTTTTTKNPIISPHRAFNSPSNKSLPRLLCRNRSFNDASRQDLNQTGILFKKVETLFQKIKSSPSLDRTTADLLSKMATFSSKPPLKPTKISVKLLEFRPKHRDSISKDSLLYNDERRYFNNTDKNAAIYDLYDPYSDKKLILDLYNNNSRHLVDTVCTIVNNMVNVVSITHNETVSTIKPPPQAEVIASKPNKTVTILPNINNSNINKNVKATSNAEILNKILSNSNKPSVIVLNNSSSNSQSTKISGIEPKKFQNPFITAVKSNLSFQQNHNSNLVQQQQPQKDYQYKTIVKLISASDILNSKNPSLTSNNQIFKVSPNTIKNETRNIAPKIFAPISLQSSSSSNTARQPHATHSRPLILKNVSQSIKTGGFIPIRPKETTTTTATTSQDIGSQKIIKLTNGPQFKCLNTTDLLNNLKTFVNSSIHKNGHSLVQQSPPQQANFKLINGKPTDKQTWTIDNFENRKRKRKQDLSIFPKTAASVAVETPNSESGHLNVPNSKDNKIGDNSMTRKINKNNPLGKHQHHASPFKISASLFKLKNFNKNNDLKNENLPKSNINSGKLNKFGFFDDDGEYDDDFDDDDFLEYGISDDEDYDQTEKSYFLSDEEGKKLFKYKIVDLDENSLKELETKSSTSNSKRSRSRKPEKPYHMNFKFNRHDEYNEDEEDMDDEENLFHINEEMNLDSLTQQQSQKSNKPMVSNAGKRHVNKFNKSKLFRKKYNTNTNRSNHNNNSSSLNNNNNSNNSNNNDDNNDDSFDSNDNKQSSSNNFSLSISSSEADDADDGLDEDEEDEEEDDSYFDNYGEDEDDCLLSATYPRSYATKKPVSNSLHSIKERERRDTLKKLFSRLKLSMFKYTHEIETGFYEDCSLKALKEELNLANSNPRMKSKQRTLLEAVQNIHILEMTAANLKSVLEEQKQYSVSLTNKLNELKQI